MTPSHLLTDSADEVADGFGLKLELKRMGCIGMAGVSVWVRVRGALERRPALVCV